MHRGSLLVRQLQRAAFSINPRNVIISSGDTSDQVTWDRGRSPAANQAFEPLLLKRVSPEERKTMAQYAILMNSEIEIDIVNIREVVKLGPYPMGKFRFGGNGEADLHTIVEKSEFERAYY
jgi:hypothetical protein